jgi:hypothetical protein
MVTDMAPLASAAEREATEAKPVAGVLSLSPSTMRTLRHVEPVGDHLGEGGGVALAVRLHG